jgi:hypothetical protein
MSNDKELAALREELDRRQKLWDQIAEDGRTSGYRAIDAEHRNRELEKEKEFLLAELRKIAKAPTYMMVEEVNGGYTQTPGLDTYEWFRWNGEGRPIYKRALCDVILSDGSMHFNVSPHGLGWYGDSALYVIMARHGPNLDCMEEIDRPEPRIYPAKPTESGASE